MPHSARLHVLPLVVSAVLLASGCRAVVSAFGTDVPALHANADAFLGALEQRFTRVVRVPKVLNARLRIARYAFSPSKLATDTSLWTAMRTTSSGEANELRIAGALVNGRYTFVPQPRAASPSPLGDSRHVIGLTRLDSGSVWQWTTVVENSVGTLPATRANDIVRAFFLSAERHPTNVRNDYSTAFPHSAAALGTLFAIDSLNTATQSDGSTLAALHILASDVRLAKTHPALAKFVREYVLPARFRARLADRASAEWFRVSIERGRVVLQFRTRGGELQPLTGASRRMPDTLALLIDASAKLSFFRVGVSELEGEFVHVSSSSERAWQMRFTREPHWDLPLLTEKLLHAPLMRPFLGEGVQFRIGFSGPGTSTAGSAAGPSSPLAPSQPTLLARTLRLAVQESAIMRFLGNLGFTAMSDYSGASEQEGDRFLAEAFAALRADIRALR